MTVHLQSITFDCADPPAQAEFWSAAETKRVVALGATVVGEHDEWGVQWVTFKDPEGNEFCIGRHPRPEG